MISIQTQPAEENLLGQSKWWGFPDLPEELDWPSVPVNDDGDVYDDPLTFICQIRCEELAPFDPEGLLPHTGMLWFFASLDYFLGNPDAVCPGMGEWEYPYFRVLYSDDLDSLHEHTLLYDDGTPAVLPSEAIRFSRRGQLYAFAGATLLRGSVRRTARPDLPAAAGRRRPLGPALLRQRHAQFHDFTRRSRRPPLRRRARLAPFRLTPGLSTNSNYIRFLNDSGY